MSKKKSVILDDDPLAWLKDENTTDANDTHDADTESFTKEQISDANLTLESEVKNCHDADMIAGATENSENTEAQYIKQNAESSEHKEEMLLGEVEMTSESEGEVQSFDNNASQESNTEHDSAQLNEKGEEGVAMATSNIENIILEEDVCIIQVAGLKEAWLPVLDSGKDISINASAVEEIDTAGLQLLLSLVKTVKDSGRSVSWESPSEPIMNAVKETSLRDELGICL